MQIRTFFTVFCILCSLKTFATNGADSIGVENNNGKQVILYKIEPKETYYLLGRKYGVSPKTIIDFNNNKSLHPGTQIKIPTERPFQTEAPANTDKAPAKVYDEGQLIDYKVGAKETLYSISKRFNIPVEDIERINNLKGTALRVGQVIKVPQNSDVATKTSEGEQKIIKATPVKVPVTTVDTPVTASDTSSLDPEAKLRIAANRYGLKQQSERGVAVWIADESVDPTKMLVLHRSAPVGTIIKITNPMTEKSTFAKVVGKFTENETTHDVIIVVTKATADVLGALDKRFQVNIVYGVPNEQ
ncbi:LysM peptidoglycan-binding domain-containing protein [Pedobacter sp. HMF7647]|uniref:LysM peptidoglycan-binding domain-containing protein n=1 Tax=Hufsiella arboris TaxID=2695275 RepID=A0A7K1Y7X8_9SPHI|nr:LysM peptidoglycan-binding domain-containing protein [Hufsiella arboris]MXV50693.1 LysM peptidoglycan-binding domain-containing protein [Hufsiella arboris]